MKLNLKRPLVFFDLETTGTNILRDRIVEISAVKVFPDGREPEEKTRRLNPEMPIPAGLDGCASYHRRDGGRRANLPPGSQITSCLL